MNRLPALFLFISIINVGQRAIVFGQEMKLGPHQLVVECQHCSGQAIKVINQDLIGSGVVSLAEGSFNSEGNVRLSVAVDDTLLAVVSMESNLVYPIFLVPTEQTKIVISRDTVLFSGKNHLINQYLRKSSILSQLAVLKANEFNAINGRDDSLNRSYVSDSLSNFFTALHIDIRGDPNLSIDIKNLLVANNEFLVRMLANAGQYKRNAGKPDSNAVAYEFCKDMPISNLIAKAGVNFYGNVLSYEISHNLLRPLYEMLEKQGKSENMDMLMSLAERVILRNERLESARELLLALNLKICLSENGVTPPVVRLFANFENSYPRSRYLPFLKSKFDKMSQIKDGEAAPDFMGRDIRGGFIKLSDLKGKIVYIDVWATWCGPCLAEFKYSKELKERYRTNSNVVFLFVSLDENVARWRSFLRRNKSLTGIHVNANDFKDQLSIMELYQFNAIPHYMLIDAFGMIKSADAPRPSDSMAGELIDEMLKGQ